MYNWICELACIHVSSVSLPEKYWNLKLPHKLPPHKKPMPLTGLPMLGYMEQGVATALIAALTAAGNFKPKYPFISSTRSALLYVAYHLKGEHRFCYNHWRLQVFKFGKNFVHLNCVFCLLLVCWRSSKTSNQGCAVKGGYLCYLNSLLLTHSISILAFILFMSSPHGVSFHSI